MSKQYLFLDFDGVLHPEFCLPTRYLASKPLLEDVLRAAPWVQVVVSSTWRHSRSLADFQGMFSEDVSPRIVGLTPNYSDLPDVKETLVGYAREAECSAWLSQHANAFDSWLALDDRAWHFRPFSSNLFLLEGKVGLDDQAAEKLSIALRGH